MKARVKATGEIVEVNQCSILYDDGISELMYGKELEEVQGAPDYWTRLEHTYAGMAMQGILSNHNLYNSVIKMTQVSGVAIAYAQELVEKLKEEK